MSFIMAYRFFIAKMLSHIYYSKSPQISNLFLNIIQLNSIFEGKDIKYQSTFIYFQKALQNKALKRTKRNKSFANSPFSLTAFIT